MPERQYTADELTDAIASALHDHNVVAAVNLLKRLAFVDPYRAQDVLDAIEAGLAIAGVTDA